MYVIQMRSSEQIERLECERKGLLKTTNGISQNEYYDISLLLQLQPHTSPYKPKVTF